MNTATCGLLNTNLLQKKISAAHSIPFCPQLAEIYPLEKAEQNYTKVELHHNEMQEIQATAFLHPPIPKAPDCAVTFK